MRTVSFAWLAVAAALTFAASAPATAALAPVDYKLQQSYDISTLYDLNHGLSGNTYANGGGSSNSYNVAAPGGTIYDGFLKDPFNPPLQTYIIFTSNLGDEAVEGQNDGHLVIGIEESLAASLLGNPEDFATVFDGFAESSLIAALTLLDTPDLDENDPGYSDQMQAKEDAYELLGSFADKLASMNGLTNADGGVMTLVGYSDPTNIGSVTANLNRVPVAGPVPEPATWLLMVAGFGAIGFALRSRKQSDLAFT